MNIVLKCGTALGLALALGVTSAPAAFAKAHGSGVSDDSSPPQGGRSSEAPPGETTSGTAQGFGSPEMGDVISGAARSGEPGFSEGKGTFGDSDPGFGGSGNDGGRGSNQR